MWRLRQKTLTERVSTRLPTRVSIPLLIIVDHCLQDDVDHKKAMLETLRDDMSRMAGKNTDHEQAMLQRVCFGGTWTPSRGEHACCMYDPPIRSGTIPIRDPPPPVGATAVLGREMSADIDCAGRHNFE